MRTKITFDTVNKGKFAIIPAKEQYLEAKKYFK